MKIGEGFKIYLKNIEQGNDKKKSVHQGSLVRAFSACKKQSIELDKITYHKYDSGHRWKLCMFDLFVCDDALHPS